jgi:hypothetical protein
LAIAGYVMKLLLEKFAFLNSCGVVSCDKDSLHQLPQEVHFRHWPQIKPLSKNLVEIDGKVIYKIGHPLTSFGWSNHHQLLVLPSSRSARL